MAFCPCYNAKIDDLKVHKENILALWRPATIPAWYRKPAPTSLNNNNDINNYCGYRKQLLSAYYMPGTI